MPCESRYDHNKKLNKPADRRAKQVSQGYKGRFKQLDRPFAADVVGDGSGVLVLSPFEASQGQFY